VRNALILLAVVALLILVVGALNNGTAFDVDYVAGTASAVSLFWVSAVIAALVFVVGLAAAWFAQAATTGSRRKLEAELQSTYERLREAEALAARSAPAVVEAPSATEAAPAVASAAALEATVIAVEAATVVVAEDETVVSGASVDDEVAAVDEAAPAATTMEPGEATAVTMTGDAGADGADESRAAESPAEDVATGEGEAGRTGS
jgi:hypothetical protein